MGSRTLLELLLACGYPSVAEDSERKIQVPENQYDDVYPAERQVFRCDRDYPAERQGAPQPQQTVLPP